MTSLNPSILIVSAVFSSISTLGSAARVSFKIARKHQTNKDAYLNLTILIRDIERFLSSDDNDVDDCDSFISEINNRLCLIEDSVSLIRTDD